MIAKKFFSLSRQVQIELLFYPIFLLYRMPIAWCKSLWGARILLNGQWSRFMGFHPRNAINSFFYRTQWININRYGRKGNSPVIGLGNYPLKNWFHLSLPASYIYATAGAVTTLASTLVWVFSHFIWLGSVQIWWGILVITILFFSSTAYSMAFARQNYQMLGWMLLPSALFFSVEGLYIPATFAWFFAGLAGVTPIFFAILIILTLAMINSDYVLLLVILPALVNVLLRLKPLLLDGGVSQAMINTAKLIGVTQREVRYSRGMQRLHPFSLYFVVLYAICSILMSIDLNLNAPLVFLPALIFFINERFFRVADEQSLIVVAVSLFTYTAIQSEPSWLMLLAFWLAINPLGFLLSIQRFTKDKGIETEILVNPPFDHTPLEIGMQEFFRQVQSGQKVYFAYEDPLGRYSNIFDGYRVIHELPLQIASKNEIHLFPDWWAVSETNYRDAPQCWGRSIKEILDNCYRWNANFVIIYQETNTKLSAKWLDHFDLLSEFDWGDYEYLLRGVALWSEGKSTPKWFLLKIKPLVNA